MNIVIQRNLKRRPPKAVERGQAMERIKYLWEALDTIDWGLFIQAAILMGTIIASYVVLCVVV